MAESSAPGRVLVVDDDAFMRRFLGDVLAPDGHDVALAASGMAALDHVSARGADVVLLDVVLPDMPGLQVLERLHGLDPGIAVVCVTGLKDAETVIGALRGRAFDYLVKPVVPAVLRRTVERALQTQRLLGENRALHRALRQVTFGQRVLGARDMDEAARITVDALAALTGVVRAVVGAGDRVLASHGLEDAEALARLAALGPPGDRLEVAAAGAPEVMLRLNVGEAGVHGAAWRVADASPFSRADVETAQFLLANTRTALQHHVRFAEAQDAARRDHLTGLLNATVLEEGLAQALARHQDGPGTVGVVFMDLDGFKAVNDVHGHLVGSRTLVELGGLLSRAVRNEDLLCRFGGDEFVIVLPDTTPAHVLSVAERLRASVSRHRFLTREGRSIQLTLSVGLATFPLDGRTARDLLQRADAAMYEAKRQGKNRVVASVDLRSAPSG